MPCSTTMTHMCSWSGGTDQCGRCGDAYCNYHFETNNGVAAGGHVCGCAEGGLNPGFAQSCSGTFKEWKKCPTCGKNLCHSHLPPNNGGSVGGHSGCSGKKCEVVVGGFTCGGMVTQCPDCEYHFCSNHKQPGIKNGAAGHGCDVGCMTTVHTKVNCCGKKSELIKCKLCAKAGNDYYFCAYHAQPVATLISIGAENDQGGGHVCKGYTSGSMLIGDSAADFFLLACDMAVTVASAGTVNPAAATIAGNAIQVSIYELFEMIGIGELMEMKNDMMKSVDAWKAKKQGAKGGDADDDKNELSAKVKKFGNNMKKLNADFAKLFEGTGNALEAGKVQFDVVINACDKITKVLDLLGDLQKAFASLKDSLKKPINPVAVIETVKKSKGLVDKVIAMCS